MHVFAVDYYKKPVAVNDIGFVSYDNDNFVLDMYGLSSMDAFRARSTNESHAVDWMDSLARVHNVKVAMVYDSWFPTLPDRWEKIAELRLSGRQISVGGSKVSVFVLDGAVLQEVREDWIKIRARFPIPNIITVY